MSLRVCNKTDRQLVSSCVKFISWLSARKFYEFQDEIATRVVESLLLRDGEFITGLVSRQAGKTEIVSKVAIGLAVLLPILAKTFPDDPRLARFSNGLRVLIYGPSEEKAKLPYDRIRKLVKDKASQEKMKSLGVSQEGDRATDLTLSNGSAVIAQTASENTNNEGQTGHLVIFEEMQAIGRRKIVKEILPITTNTRGTVVGIGTPDEVSGYFREVILRNIETEKGGGPKNHFEANCHVVIAHKAKMYAEEKRLHKLDNTKHPLPNEDHLNYQLSVEKAAKDIGSDSSAFKMNYLLMWQEIGAGAIDKARWNASALKHLELGRRVYGGVRVAAIDVGKIRDSTFVTVADVDWDHPIKNHQADAGSDEDAFLYRKVITDYAMFLGPFETKDGVAGQYDRIMDFLIKAGVSLVVVDCTAMGDPVTERIEVMGEDVFEVVPYRWTATSKLQAYKHYIDEIDAGRVLYAAGPMTEQTEVYKEFYGQHFELLKVVDEDKMKVKYQAPSGYHDDAPDSGAMLCQAVKVVKSRIMPYVEMSDLPGRSRSGHSGTIAATQPTQGRRRKLMSSSPIYKRRR